MTNLDILIHGPQSVSYTLPSMETLNDYIKRLDKNIKKLEHDIVVANRRKKLERVLKC